MRMNIVDEKHCRTCRTCSSYRTRRHIRVRRQFQHITNTYRCSPTASTATATASAAAMDGVRNGSNDSRHADTTNAHTHRGCLHTTRGELHRLLRCYRYNGKASFSQRNPRHKVRINNVLGDSFGALALRRSMRSVTDCKLARGSLDVHRRTVPIGVLSPSVSAGSEAADLDAVMRSRNLVLKEIQS